MNLTEQIKCISLRSKVQFQGKFACVESCNEDRRVGVTELEVPSTKFAQQLHSSDVGMREKQRHMSVIWFQGGKPGKRNVGSLKIKPIKSSKFCLLFPQTVRFVGLRG